MDKKTITLIVIFFLVVVMGMFTFAYLKKNEITQVASVESVEVEPELQYPSVTRIEGKHYFIDGVHTVVGEILMPTPCDLLEASSLVAAENPNQIILDFNVINNANFCTQQITPQRYKVSQVADADATFSALFMDRGVELNLIPAEPGEKPEEFEIFIKG